MQASRALSSDVLAYECKPRDPQLPHTWHRDLAFARDLLRSDHPKGVLWATELRNERSHYRLIVLSETRLYVTNGKQGFTGHVENAHLFDLERVLVAPGDRMEFHFKKMKLVLDDTIGPLIVTTLWNALLALSFEVPQSRLPSLEGVAGTIIEEMERTVAPSVGTAPSAGFSATYRGACDHIGVKPRGCVQRYIMEFKWTPKDDELRCFDLSVACRDAELGGKFVDIDFPALSRALAVTTYVDAVALIGRPRPGQDAKSAQATLSGEAARALLSALETAPRVRRVMLHGVGLNATKLDKLDTTFRRITHWCLSENPGLGSRGLAKLLGDDKNVGPEKLERLECRNCGPLKSVPLRPQWCYTLGYLDLSLSDLSKASDSVCDWLAAAHTLEVLVLAHCGINVLSVLAALAKSEKLMSGGVLRIVDVSLNKCPDDGNGCQACQLLTHKAAGLERLALNHCDIAPAALDAVLLGLNNRARDVHLKASASVARALSTRGPAGLAQADAKGETREDATPVGLLLAENGMDKKMGAIFFERLGPQGPAQVCAPLQLLNLDRCHLGTLGLRDLFAALAASKAPQLVTLSLRSTASKGGMFANKKKHEEMAKSLADVVRSCASLERLYLTGGEGSFFKADLLPALAELANNTSLTVLDISNNQCGDDSLQALAHSLVLNQTLYKLVFDQNAASPTAIHALVKAMDSNRTLCNVEYPKKDCAMVVRQNAAEADAMSKALKDMRATITRNLKAAAKTERRPSKHALPHIETFFSTSSSSPVDDVIAFDLDAAPSSSVTADDGAESSTVDGGSDSGDAEASQEPKSGRATPPPVPPVDASSPNMAKEGDVPHQMKIFQEILESETNYVRDLGVLCHIFMAPIQKHEILKKEEIDKVFGNIREIRQIHEELLSKLRQADREHQDLCNGGKPDAEAAAAHKLAATHAKVFAEMVPFLRAYAGYCSTYSSAIQLVKQLSEGRSNQKFAKFLQRVSTVPQCRGLDLSSFLIKPPQRLCKYPLFFRDLLKHMGEDEAESAARIADTLERVQDVANAVNKTMANSGSMAKVFEIFKDNLDSHESVSDLVTPTRRFLFEGDVDFASFERAPKRHHFYLFNDLMLLCTPRRALVSGHDLPGKFKVKHRFALIDFDIIDAPAPLALNQNDYLFRMRFEERQGGTASSHWHDGARPPRTDFLLWTDGATECEKLRAALEQACYDITLQQQDMNNRRRSTSTSSVAVSSPSSVTSSTASPSGNRSTSPNRRPDSGNTPPGKQPSPSRQGTTPTKAAQMALASPVILEENSDDEDGDDDHEVTADGRPISDPPPGALLRGWKATTNTAPSDPKRPESTPSRPGAQPPPIPAQKAAPQPPPIPAPKTSAQPPPIPPAKAASKPPPPPPKGTAKPPPLPPQKAAQPRPPPKPSTARPGPKVTRTMEM